jgi:hypothetical protein
MENIIWKTIREGNIYEAVFSEKDAPVKGARPEFWSEKDRTIKFKIISEREDMPPVSNYLFQHKIKILESYPNVVTRFEVGAETFLRKDLNPDKWLGTDEEGTAVALLGMDINGVPLEKLELKQGGGAKERIKFLIQN